MEPQVSETVQYFVDSTSSEPIAAIVKSISRGGRLCLGLCYPGMHNMDEVDGVPHISEASSWTQELVGFWAHRPRASDKAKAPTKKAVA